MGKEGGSYEGRKGTGDVWEVWCLCVNPASEALSREVRGREDVTRE